MKKKLSTQHCIIAGTVGVVVVIAAVGMRRREATEEQAPARRDTADLSRSSVEPPARAPVRANDSQIACATAIEKPVQARLPEAGLFEMPCPAVSQPADKTSVTSAAPQTPAPVKKDKEPQIPQKLNPAPVDSKDLPLGPLVSPSILVEKSALRLTVFDGDAGMKSYRVAVGANHGDKQREGDRRTPEGDFYICIRKPKDKTPYTRSFGLSYPNLEDAERGIRNGLITAAQKHAIVTAIRKGDKPPWQTTLGGAIMIHGKREGRTGTLGCVALDDDDIVELYNRLPLRAPVRIVP